MPQKPGLEMPTNLGPSQRTLIRSATLFRSKQELRSVETSMLELSPTTIHGNIFEGTLGPPASKPLLLTSFPHSPPAPAWLISCQTFQHSYSLPIKNQTFFTHSNNSHFYESKFWDNI